MSVRRGLRARDSVPWILHRPALACSERASAVVVCVAQPGYPVSRGAARLVACTGPSGVAAPWRRLGDDPRRQDPNLQGVDEKKDPDAKGPRIVHEASGVHSQSGSCQRPNAAGGRDAAAVTLAALVTLAGGGEDPSSGTGRRDDRPTEWARRFGILEAFHGAHSFAGAGIQPGGAHLTAPSATASEAAIVAMRNGGTRHGRTNARRLDAARQVDRKRQPGGRSAGWLALATTKAGWPVPPTPPRWAPGACSRRMSDWLGFECRRAGGSASHGEWCWRAGSRAQGGGDALGPAGEARAWRADGRIIINQPDWTAGRGLGATGGVARTTASAPQDGPRTASPAGRRSSRRGKHPVRTTLYGVRVRALAGAVPAISTARYRPSPSPIPGRRGLIPPRPSSSASQVPTRKPRPSLLPAGHERPGPVQSSVPSSRSYEVAAPAPAPAPAPALLAATHTEPAFVPAQTLFVFRGFRPHTKFLPTLRYLALPHGALRRSWPYKVPRLTIPYLGLPSIGGPCHNRPGPLCSRSFLVPLLRIPPPARVVALVLGATLRKTSRRPPSLPHRTAPHRIVDAFAGAVLSRCLAASLPSLASFAPAGLSLPGVRPSAPLVLQTPATTPRSLPDPRTPAPFHHGPLEPTRLALRLEPALRILQPVQPRKRHTPQHIAPAHHCVAPATPQRPQPRPSAASDTPPTRPPAAASAPATRAPRPAGLLPSPVPLTGNDADNAIHARHCVRDRLDESLMRHDLHCESQRPPSSGITCPPPQAPRMRPQTACIKASRQLSAARAGSPVTPLWPAAVALARAATYRGSLLSYCLRRCRHHFPVASLLLRSAHHVRSPPRNLGSVLRFECHLSLSRWQTALLIPSLGGCRLQLLARLPWGSGDSARVPRVAGHVEERRPPGIHLVVFF
ncbi:hypothetical protein PCL_10675 [Purpureocillium lilacinum]|uniref:Uncharacterized protein n=1 Tax=Purpureocillium lilacinum TaxID=33203 RepID=A0A2U3EC33_PURLI|nr:hypothetical protein PCL_10675 [Purpureocillium lilacinum]